ncbi:hypothetical protein [Paraburkholderia sp. EG304]|uniref:hypothetical protein n=1 Tax=Paraburkholderia sp. EG304 TaxID=3237015 RepID=UPI00397D0A21
MSWHHGDYLSLAQAIAATLAVIGAFAVVFYQHWLLESNRRKDAQRDQRTALRLAQVFVEHALETSKALELSSKKMEFAKRESENAVEVLRDRRSAFDDLPLNQLSRPHVVAVTRTRTCMTKLISICRQRRLSSEEAFECEVMPPLIRSVSHEIANQLDELNSEGRID